MANALGLVSIVTAANLETDFVSLEGVWPNSSTVKYTINGTWDENGWGILIVNGEYLHNGTPCYIFPRANGWKVGISVNYSNSNWTATKTTVYYAGSTVITHSPFSYFNSSMNSTYQILIPAAYVS